MATRTRAKHTPGLLEACESLLKLAERTRTEFVSAQESEEVEAAAERAVVAARCYQEAAPDLLAVCHQARECLDRIKDAAPANSPYLKSGSLLNKTLAALLSAIAKATGATP